MHFFLFPFILTGIPLASCKQLKDAVFLGGGFVCVFLLFKLTSEMHQLGASTHPHPHCTRVSVNPDIANQYLHACICRNVWRLVGFNSTLQQHCFGKISSDLLSGELRHSYFFFLKAAEIFFFMAKTSQSQSCVGPDQNVFLVDPNLSSIKCEQFFSNLELVGNINIHFSFLTNYSEKYRKVT